VEDIEDHLRKEVVAASEVTTSARVGDPTILRRFGGENLGVRVCLDGEHERSVLTRCPRVSGVHSTFGNADLTPSGGDKGWRPKKERREVCGVLLVAVDCYSTVERCDVQSFCCRENYYRKT
jgi:hypothetical protein